MGVATNLDKKNSGLHNKSCQESNSDDYTDAFPAESIRFLLYKSLLKTRTDRLLADWSELVLEKTTGMRTCLPVQAKSPNTCSITEAASAAE